jgi:parallel beta-helix repeat protein
MFAGIFTAIIIQNDFAASNVLLKNTAAQSVSIEPAGPIKLLLNQSQVFTVNTNSQDAPSNYSWSLYSGSSDLPINKTTYLLVTQGKQADFKFLTDNLDIFWLSVTLNSATGLANSTVIIQCIALPQSNQTIQQTTSQQVNEPSQTTGPTQTPSQTQEPNQDYISAPIKDPFLNADLIVQNDVKHHYQVINGTDDSIITSYSSDSANTTLNDAIAIGGTIAIMSGDYTGTQLAVPSNANIISAADVLGINYASIGNGARIDEPNFNAAFGGYQTGAYTVTTNATSSATPKTTYLAFKPDNSIYFTSSNASYVLNKVASFGGGIFIVGNLTLTSPVVLSVSRTSIYSDGTGVLTFNNVDGLNITATEVTISNLCLRQTDLARTRNGITCSGTSLKQVGYETFSNIKLWGWNEALVLKYTTSSQANGVDTAYSLTGLYIWGQSTNNVFTNCQFTNFGTSSPTVLIERDENKDISPEGNMISNSLIYGGNPAIYLHYAFATQISNSIIDGWNQQGVKIIGRKDNSLSDNWIGASPESTNSSAIEINSDSTNIKGNTISSVNWTIYVHDSKNCLISDNSFTTAAQIDIFAANNNIGIISNNNFVANSQVGIATQNSDGFSIYSNTITGKTTAINIITSNHTTIVSNIINGTQQNAIILDASSYNSITSNSISNSGQQTNNSYADIWLVDNSTHNNVCDNTINALEINKSSWGILESSLADDYNVYSGNTLTGQASGAIGVAGPNSVRGSNNPLIG